MVTALLSVWLAATPVRVAVLPFEISTPEPEYAVLRQGLADLLVTDLVGAEPLEIVERARLDAVLLELKLQESRFFDPKQTVKVGQVLGAAYAIAGTLVGVKPQVRLTARVIDVAKGTVLITASAQGTPADLFELEQQLVKQLVTSLRAKTEGLSGSGHTSLEALVVYAQGTALADQGQLDAAKSKLAEAVRLSPDFVLAQQRYAELIKRLREAQKTRASTFEVDAKALSARLLVQVGQAPVNRALAARVGLANLALLSLSRLVGAEKDHAVYVPPAQRAAVELLERDFVTHASALVTELRAARGKHPEPALDDVDQAFSEQHFGLNVATWDFATATSVAIDLGNFLGSGWTPYRSDVPAFAVRPSPAQRTPAQLQAARGWFDAARKELALDSPPAERAPVAGRLANEFGEMLVLLGRREEAVAQWQGFLDAYPTSEEFPVLSKKVEAVLLLDEAAARDERLIKACDAAVLSAEVMTRTWRAKGRAGVVSLAQTLASCAKKDPTFEQTPWTLAGAELRRVGDAEGLAQLRSK